MYGVTNSTDKPSQLRVTLHADGTMELFKKLSKGKGKVFPLQARLWARGWEEV